MQKLKIKKYDFDLVYWFHLTRTFDIDSYKINGILSLGQSFEKIFDDLYKLINNEVTPQKWADILRNSAGGPNSSIYLEKRNNVRLQGPFAFMVKEYGKLHNYLNIPEIIEDIIIGLKINYGIDLRKRYDSQTLPYIIKFYQNTNELERKNDPGYYLDVAVFYLYKSLNKQLTDDMLNCNTNYDGYGQSVSANRIIDIELFNS